MPSKLNRLSAQKKIQNASHVSLLLDFDGTLAPLVRYAHQAKLLPGFKPLLRKISKQRKFQVSIVSGRDIKTVRKKIGLTNLIYAGNHGFEISFPRKKLFIHPSGRKTKKLITTLCRQLNKRLRSIHGAIVENKIYSASLHTRPLNATEERKAHRIFQETVDPYLKKKQIKVTHGKKVREIRPPAKWHKGKAIEFILKKEKKRTFPVYAGDDRTDEDAFSVVKNRGLAIKIGLGTKTKATLKLKNPSDFYRFLKSI